MAGNAAYEEHHKIYGGLWKEGPGRGDGCAWSFHYLINRCLTPGRDPKVVMSYDELLENWVANQWLASVEEANVRFCLKHFPVIKDPDGLTPMSRCRVVVDGNGLSE